MRSNFEFVFSNFTNVDFLFYLIIMFVLSNFGQFLYFIFVKIVFLVAIKISKKIKGDPFDCWKLKNWKNIGGLFPNISGLLGDFENFTHFLLHFPFFKNFSKNQRGPLYFFSKFFCFELGDISLIIPIFYIFQKKIKLVFLWNFVQKYNWTFDKSNQLVYLIYNIFFKKN